MSARTKLNAIHLGWIALFSIFAALLFGSWIAGLTVAIVMAAIAVHSGKLRLLPAQGTWRMPERLRFHGR